jgi:gliding motility-associated-like protein
MRFFYLLLLTCLALFKVNSQIDTSFWFAAPKVPAPIGTTSIGLQIGSYTQAVTVRVRQPANAGGVNLVFNLAANTSTLVDLTASSALFVNTTANVVSNLGLYISSTGSVSVNYIIESVTSKENISIKGRNGIGDDFYAPFTSSINTLYNGVAGNTGFDIIATEPGVTALLITPKGNLIGPHPKNVSFITSLTQGQTFSCQENLFTRSPISSVSKDFDGDGMLDIALVDNKFSSVFILKGNGAGGFSENGVHIVGSQPVHIIADDVNNDGNQDLITANFGEDNCSVLLGNGTGGFGAAINSNCGGQNPMGIACSDLNGDGNKDLVMTNQFSFQFTVLLGNGSGAFTHTYTYTTPQQPIDIKISDFTNDGIKDVVVTNFASNNISVFTGTSSTNGGFNPTPTNYACATNPYRTEVVDLNADGFEDVIVANRGSANIRVFLSNAVGTFTGITAYAAGTNPESVCTATINADGFRDIAVCNAGSNNVSVLFGAAAGAFGTATTVPNAVGTNPRCIISGDFNQDGLPDFNTPNFTGNNYSILTGNGTATLSPIVNTILGTVNYPATELSGSIISADKKVAVTVSGALGGSSVCASYYADQITPTNKLGMHFVIHRTNTSSDQTYILAPSNSTSLSITSATTTNWLINNAETFRVNTAGNALTYIQTDKPVYVFNVGGRGCRLSGAQIAPAYCAGSYTASFSRESSDSLFLDVYVRSAAIGTFTLDINNVPTTIASSNFTVVPGTAGNLFGARIYFNTATIPLGAYCILRNSVDLFGFSVQNGSNATGSFLSHHSSFNTQTFVKANSVPTATICTNTTFTLNGSIGGGPNTGIWTSNGYGTLSGGPNLIANNIYTPNQLDTTLIPIPTPTPWVGGLINFVLTSTGICPNLTDTVKVRVRQGPIVNAGPDQIKCTNNATIGLSGSVLGAASQGTWAVSAPGTGTFSNSSALQTTYTPTSADTSLTQLQMILTSINNGICAAASDIVVIQLQKAPLVDAAPTSSIVKCTNNATVNLVGYISNNIPNGIWTTSGSGVFIPNNISLSNNYLPSLTDMSTGPIKLKLTTPPSALCKDVSDSVYVYFQQPASVSAGADLNSCKNNPIIPLNAIITGTSSSTVMWSGGTGTFTPSNALNTTTYIATVAETTVGFVILTVSTTANGLCLAATDQIRIDFRDKPKALFTSNAVCLNQPSQFNDNSINPSGIGVLSGWQWNFGNGQNSTNTSPVITYTAPGTYSVMLVVNNSFNCYDTITKSTTIHPLPNIKFAYSRQCTGSAQNICFIDSTTILPPSSIPPTGHYWDFGGVGFSVTKDTCFIFPTDGKYSITKQVTSVDGCVSTVVQTLNITPRPIAKFRFLNPQQLSLGSNIQFIDSSKYATGWSWNFGNGSSSNLQNPNSIYTSNGTYTVIQTVTDQFGCTASFSLELGIRNVITDITELIPNVISPNGDGKNDYWRLDFIDVFYPKAEIEIFNRWGESIFRSTGYSNAWDGTYRGDPLPVGAYYFTIDLKDPVNPGVVKGNITLLK